MSVESEAPVYLRGLNGLRAIAAVSVLFSHIMQPEFGDFGFAETFMLPMAQFGVTLFFVISGFLITYLLLKERDKGEINIKNFYIRRALRIWPLYYLYIICCLLVWLITDTEKFELSYTFIWYIILAANVPFILQKGILLIIHYWSIGVEEQFYLFWPIFVKLSKTRKLLLYTALLFTFLILAKLILWYFLGKESILYRSLSVSRFHCMLIGAIGAIVFKDYTTRYLKIIGNKMIQSAIWLCLILIGMGVLIVPAPIAHEFIATLSILIIYGQVSVTGRLINLENRLCVFLGSISYGIYIIHPLVIYLVSPVIKKLVITMSLRYVIVYGVVSTLTILFAYFSSIYVEKYFIQLKERYTTIHSSNLPVIGSQKEVAI